MDQKELFSQLSDNISLNDIQAYIKNVIELRGFGNQSVQAELLLLLEETGELAKAVRKTIAGMSVDPEKLHNYDSVESELADVFIVLLSICNKMNISLYEALVEKEEVNLKRSWRVNEG